MKLAASPVTVDGSKAKVGASEIVKSPAADSLPQIRSAPPYLGQHTDHILKDILGYSEDQISRLAETKAT